MAVKKVNDLLLDALTPEARSKLVDVREELIERQNNGTIAVTDATAVPMRKRLSGRAPAVADADAQSRVTFLEAMFVQVGGRCA